MKNKRTRIESQEILLNRLRVCINAHCATNKVTSIELIGALDVLKTDAWNEMDEPEENPEQPNQGT